VFTTEIRVGRLVEIRLVAPLSVKDIEGVRTELYQSFRRVPGKVVCVTDWTRANFFTPAEAMRILEVFRADNPRIERSGFLITHGISFHHQVENLISQAGNSGRRTFFDADELKAFLAGNLTTEEQDRLAQFLAERP
jgi:hypothetical protein